VDASPSYKYSSENAQYKSRNRTEQTFAAPKEKEKSSDVSYNEYQNPSLIFRKALFHNYAATENQLRTK